MSVWRQKAIELFPELNRELAELPETEQPQSLYEFWIEHLRPMWQRASTGDDDELLARIYRYLAIVNSNEMLPTSVGGFEVDWWVGASGSLSIGLDPDFGFADLPEIIEVASPSDVAAALREVGVPSDEAAVLAPGLWERRWQPGAA